MRILHRRDGRVLWEGEAATLAEAVKQAIASNANLVDANLRNANLRNANLDGANLDDANLRNANLDGANLDGASLVGANLRNANLDGASLVGANLDGASLDGANLDGASLVGANLRNANLDGANLDGAELDGANLRNANLDGANLDGAELDGASLEALRARGALVTDGDYAPYRDDLFAVLNASPDEVPGLTLALEGGRVDGSCYQGACSCLLGTIATVRGVKYDQLGIVPNSERPAERWFMAIRPGHTPAHSTRVRRTLAWIEEWRAAQAVPPC